MTWFVTVRVVEVGVLALLLGTAMDASATWDVGAQYAGFSSEGSPVAVSFMQRIAGMALFGGYRGTFALMAAVLTIAGLLVVLHRCQPVSHTRVLRWEWLALWGAAALLALTSTAVGVLALFSDDPYASSAPAETDQVVANIGPGYHEQVIGNLSVPLGALLLLLPLGVWWARLPDIDDLEDALAREGDGERADEGSGSSATIGSRNALREEQLDEVGSRPSDGTRPGRLRRMAVARSGRDGRDGRAGRDGDPDAIFIDGVEQIQPVERLSPRGADRGDGSSSSGYDEYFRRP